MNTQSPIQTTVIGCGGMARHLVGNRSSSWPYAAEKIPNPSPPEIGLRMAHFWDAIEASAEQGGELVNIQ